MPLRRFIAIKTKVIFYFRQVLLRLPRCFVSSKYSNSSLLNKRYLIVAVSRRAYFGTAQKINRPHFCDIVARYMNFNEVARAKGLKNSATYLPTVWIFARRLVAIPSLIMSLTDITVVSRLCISTAETNSRSAFVAQSSFQGLRMHGQKLSDRTIAQMGIAIEYPRFLLSKDCRTLGFFAETLVLRRRNGEVLVIHDKALDLPK
jgi:hypothetical protein